MSVTVKGTGQKKPHSKESESSVAGVSPTSGFFFTSPFRSLSTQGCFAKITLPAQGGDQLNGEFQQAVRHAFAEAKLAGVKTRSCAARSRSILINPLRFLFPSTPSGLSAMPFWLA